MQKPVSIKPYVLFHSGPFSQWHISSFRVDGVTYNCCEQYMMAEKARLFKDDDMHELILRATAPRQQKALGRGVRGFKEHTWKSNCLRIVTEGNLHKFRQNTELREKLMATGERTIAEAAPKDKIWGIGLHASDKRAQDMSTWRGTNLLGVALMTVRERLRKEKDDSEKKTDKKTDVPSSSPPAEPVSLGPQPEEPKETEAKRRRAKLRTKSSGRGRKKSDRRPRKSGAAGKGEWM
uniref:NADAR domain-containing protein n=1 Tax=Lotharella globosa TaxID=91324 RepID=A0A7S3Z9B3_9EUKA